MLTIPGNRKFINRVIFAPVLFGATLVTTVAATLFTVQLADGDMVGGVLEGVIRVIDATPNYQLLNFASAWSAVRKGATTTVAHTYVGITASALAVSSGTLTMTCTAADGGTGLAQFKITPATSLTATTFTVEYVIRPHRGTVAYL